MDVSRAPTTKRPMVNRIERGASQSLGSDRTRPAMRVPSREKYAAYSVAVPTMPTTIAELNPGAALYVGAYAWRCSFSSRIGRATNMNRSPSATRWIGSNGSQRRWSPRITNGSEATSAMTTIRPYLGWLTPHHALAPHATAAHARTTKATTRERADRF